MGACAMFVLLLFLPLAEATCPTTLPTDASFASAAQYHAGEYNTTSSVHLLSYANPDTETYSLAYNLISGAFMKTPSNQCPESCLYHLRAMGKPGRDGSTSSIIMKWDESNILYSAFTTTVVPKEYLYCSNVMGTCGASVPLYLYYNAETDDYHVRGDKDTVDDSKARLQNQGLPICWMFPPLQTTSSSTSTGTNGTHHRHARDVTETNSTDAKNLNQKQLESNFFSKQQLQNSLNDFTDSNATRKFKQYRDRILRHWVDSNSTNRPDTKRPFAENLNSTDRYDLATEFHKLRPNNSTDRPFHPTDTRPQNPFKDPFSRPTVPLKDDVTGRGGRGGTGVSMEKGSGSSAEEGIVSIQGDGRDGGTTDEIRETATKISESEVKNGFKSRLELAKMVAIAAAKNRTLPQDSEANAETATRSNEGSEVKDGFKSWLGAANIAAFASKITASKNLTLPPGNETISSFMKDLKPEAIEISIKNAGFDLPGNVSIGDVLQYFQEQQGNLTLEEAVKGGVVENTLASMGIVLSANFSAVDLLPLLGKGQNMEMKEGPEKYTAVEVREMLEEKKRRFIEKAQINIFGNSSVDDELVRKADKKEGFLEKALSSLSNSGNFSASDLMSTLKKAEEKSGSVEKALSSLGINVSANVSVSDLLKELGKNKDKILAGADFLQVLNASLNVLYDDVSEQPPRQSRPTKGTQLQQHSTVEVNGTAVIDNLTFTEMPLGVQSTVSVEKKADESKHFMQSVSNQTAVAVEKILARFNTSLDVIHPKFVEVNGSTPVLLAEIALPVKLSEEEMDELRNETSDVRNLRVFEDHLTVKGGDEDVSVDTKNPSGTKIPDGTKTPSGTSNWDGTKNPSGSWGPDGSRTPDVTKNPSGSSNPDGTKRPSGIRNTDVTKNPSGASSPDGTKRPSGTIIPDDTMRPNATRTSYGTNNPSGTVSDFQITRLPEANRTNVIHESTTRRLESTITNASLLSTKTYGMISSTVKPSKESNQTKANTVQIFTGHKGSSTTTSSGSSTTTTKILSSTVTAQLGIGSSTATGSSSTAETSYSRLASGSSTTTSSSAARSSTTTAPYTGAPTTSTIGNQSVSTTTLSGAATGSSSTITGIFSTMTTPKPTTTTSPYVYSATTDISRTYGPGDQKLENGTVIRPNGDTIYPNGTVRTSDGSIIEGGKKTDPDGTVHNPDGSTKYPNGTVTYPSDSTSGAGEGSKSGDDTPGWVIPVIIVGSLLIGVGALGMIFFGVTSMMKSAAPPAAVNPYETPNSNQWPTQRQPTPSADLPPPVADPVTTAQPQSFGATQTLHGAPNSLYFG